MDIEIEESQIRGTFHEIVVESIDIGILVTDCGGNLIYYNRAAETMWSLPRHQSLGQSFLLALAGAERERMRRTFDYVVRTGRTVRARDIEFVNRVGHKLYINAYASPFRYSDGDETGIVMWTENITEEQKLREEMHRADKLAALGQLSMGLAHELRTPLGTIKALAGLIDLNLQGMNPDVTRYISVLNNEVNRLDKLSRELLDFGGKSSLNREWTDINSLVEKTLYLASLSQPARSVEVIRELAADLPMVFGDPEHLLHALMNLVMNGFEALGQGGRLAIKTESLDGQVLISISDNGPGIPPDKLAKVFDPFYTTKENGTGLGLSVAHSLVSSHEGRIGVESNPGSGTVFTIFLPGAMEVEIL